MRKQLFYSVYLTIIKCAVEDRLTHSVQYFTRETGLKFKILLFFEYELLL